MKSSSQSRAAQMFDTTKFSHRTGSKKFYGSHTGDMVFSPLNSAEQTKSKYTVNMSSREVKLKETKPITSYSLPDSDKAQLTCESVNITAPAITQLSNSKSKESVDSYSESSYSQGDSELSQATNDAKSFNSSSTDLGSYFLNKHQDALKDDANGVIDRDEGFTKTVKMLMKVIIHLRQSYPTKHVYHTRDRLLESPEEYISSSDTRTTKSFGASKKISFSPKALLFSAVAEKSYTEVKSILETEDINVNSKSPSGQSLLHIAAANADLRVSQLLLQYGASVKNEDSNGWSPLHTAIRRGNWKCAILLIEAGADIAEYAQRRIQEYNDMLKISRTCYKSVEIFV